MATAARRQEEEGTDLEQVLEDYDREQSQRGMFRPSGPGVFFVRILPPRKRGLFYVPFGVHFDVGLLSPRLADQKGVGCYRETLGQECILCEQQKKLYFEGKTNNDETKLNLAKSIRAKSRRVCNIVDMKNLAAGVLTWEYPASSGPNRVSVASKINALFKEWGDITNPTEKGTIIKLTFEKKGDFLTCEDVAITNQHTAIPNTLDWRNERKDLEAYARAKIIPLDRLRVLLRPDDAKESGPVASTSTDAEVVGGDDDNTTIMPDGDDTADMAPTAGDDDLSEASPQVQKVLASLRAKGRLKE